MIIRIRIAFVTTHFPPENHVACRRNEAFARYFDRVRYDVHFIVPKRQNSAPWNLDGILVHETQNRSLLRPFTFEKAHSRFVHALMVFYNIVIRVVPAYHNRAWIKATVREFERLHRQESMHVLITQYGPIAPHIVGLRVKRRYPRIRWIADNRDVISDGPFTTRIAERQLTRLESAVVRTADAVTAVSGPFLERLARHGRSRNRCSPRYGTGSRWNRGKNSEAAGNEVFTVRYVGSLYGGRKPRAFFEALERLVTGRRIGEVRVEIAGSNPFIDIPVSLTSAVRCIGNVRTRRLLSTSCAPPMRSCSCTRRFRRRASTPRSCSSTWQPGRPIIALIDPGDVAADLIREAECGYVAANEDADGIDRITEITYHNWKERVPFAPNEEVIRSCHRRIQVARMESVIASLGSSSDG